jgi:P27 family predicted phage terminase small subunit
MPGPAPRPPKLKLLNGRHAGVDSGGRKVEPAPAFRRSAPEKPADLSPVAAEHWDLVVPELMRLELTKAPDAGSLAQLCETYARWHQAQMALNREGLFITVAMTRGLTEWTQTLPHPAVRVVEVASRDYRGWATAFGLTPSAEGRLATGERKGAGANPFAGSATQP